MRIKRYLAATLDVYIPIGIILTIFGLATKQFQTDNQLNIILLGGISWSFVLIKDIFNGQSVFKQLMGIKIMYKGTNRCPNPRTSIIRNFVSLPIIPIELIFYITTGNRIADWIFKTEVVKTDSSDLKTVITRFRIHSIKNYLEYILTGIILGTVGIYLYSELVFGLITRLKE